VLLDEKPVYACSLLAIDAQGHRITTIEGLTQGDRSRRRPADPRGLHRDPQRRRLHRRVLRQRRGRSRRQRRPSSAGAYRLAAGTVSVSRD
jgi:hypothetical protein